MSQPPTSPRPRRRAGGVALLLALVAPLAGSACSGGGDGDNDAGTSAAQLSTVRSGLATLFAGDHAAERDVAAGNCFAERLTDEVSLAQLREAGVLDASSAVVAELPVLPEEVAAPWARAQLACTDFAEESARAQVAATKGGADTAAYAACLRAALSDEALEAALVETLTGTWDGPAVARLTDAQASCVAP